MLLMLAIVLAIAWFLGFSVFGVASTAVHVLVILAAIALAGYFMRGGRRSW